MTSRAFIAGCLGTSLTPDERAFFRDARPWGFILFRRNTQDPAQVAALPAQMVDAVGGGGHDLRTGLALAPYQQVWLQPA